MGNQLEIVLFNVVLAVAVRLQQGNVLFSVQFKSIRLLLIHLRGKIAIFEAKIYQFFEKYVV